MELIPLKKGSLVLTAEWLEKVFAPETHYIYVIPLPRLILVGRLDGAKSIEDGASRATAKFGFQLSERPDLHTVTSRIRYSGKWLAEKVGLAESDLLFAITNADDPNMVAIQLISPSELLALTVKGWVEASQELDETPDHEHAAGVN